MPPASVTVFGRAGPIWARVVPFGIYMVFLAVTSLTVKGLAGGGDERWLYAVKVGFVAVALAILWRRFSELRPMRLSLAETFGGLVAGVVVFGLWINLDLPWLSLSSQGATGFDARAADGAIDWRLAAVRLAGAALVVPVMEELFWRSLVMRWIDRSDFLAVDPRSVSFRALLASSVVFGLEHQLWFAGVIAGLVYGGLYRYSGNLWLPVFAHAVTNGVLGVWVLWSGQWQFW